ncbi:MAG: AAA family ATPase [Archangium sp.]|nr:AAA family ATPase [Archangium sp.]
MVFEGLDGAGKTTIARSVAEAMNAVYMTTPSPRVRAFRDGLLAALGASQEAAQLFYLATVFAASKEVDAHLISGRSVVLDRYFLSTQAYAEFRGSVLRIDEVQRHLRPADITVFLDAPMDVRRPRIALRGESISDRETLNPQADATLRRTHAARAELPVVGRFLAIDAGRLRPDEIVARVLEEIGARHVRET